MKKLVYYVACSVDGYIAELDGSFDSFVNEGAHVTDYLESFNRFDTVLMGRNTYEVGVKMGTTNPYPMFDSYVFSTSMEESPDEDVTLVKENVIELVEDLKKRDGKAIYLCGGGLLAVDLFNAQLIDEVVLKVNPILLGEGIHFFSGVVQPANLGLIKSTAYNNGVVFLHYEVK